MSSLSTRGKAALKSKLRVDMDAYFEALQNLYHPLENPEGALPMNVAENRISVDSVVQKIQEISREKEIPSWVAGYTSGQGSPTFRESVARSFSKHLAGVPMDPENFAFSAGATSVIEMTSLVLGDRRDVVAIPSPCYPVYRQDIGNIAGLERYDITTHHEIDVLKNGMPLTVEHLAQTKKDIESQGKEMRMLIITTPDNPTGGIYSLDQLNAYANWCIENQVHLVVNEIYGLTLIDTNHSAISGDYPVQLRFKSFIPIMHERQSAYLHLWYSFSKDFCISGTRVGFVYSLNEEMIRAYANLNYSHLVSNHTQWLLEEMLNDDEFVADYIKQNQKDLTDAYALVTSGLKRLNIPFVPSRGSMFIWIDFSQFLEDNSQEGENELWQRIFDNTGILLTPGQGFGHTKRGLFRMVFAACTLGELKVVIQRLDKFCQS
jgi:aspartate/methionine/tyrosine aminotransferase